MMAKERKKNDRGERTMVEGRKQQHKGDNDGRRERMMAEGRKCDH